jgi:hypothetical protein
MSRPKLNDNQRRVHISTTVAPETARRLRQIRDTSGYTGIGDVIDSLVERRTVEQQLARQFQEGKKPNGIKDIVGFDEEPCK